MEEILVLFIWINEIDDLVWRLWLFVLANSKFWILLMTLFHAQQKHYKMACKEERQLDSSFSLVALLISFMSLISTLVYLVGFPFPFSSSNSTFPFLHTLYSGLSPAYWCTLRFAQLCNNELLIQISYFTLRLNRRRPDISGNKYYLPGTLGSQMLINFYSSLERISLVSEMNFLYNPLNILWRKTWLRVRKWWRWRSKRWQWIRWLGRSWRSYKLKESFCGREVRFVHIVIKTLLIQWVLIRASWHLLGNVTTPKKQSW